MTTSVRRLLEERLREGRPVRVAIAGCGFMGRGLVNQIVNRVPGMTLSAIAVRDPDKALKALIDAGIDNAAVVDGVRGVHRSMYHGITAVTEDFGAIARAHGIDVVIDVTGAVEFSCHLAVECFSHGKHLVLTNAEVDATVGAELARLADSAGVVYTGCDGGPPGAQMSLLEYVREIGVTPLLSGTVEVLQDPTRNPTTEESRAHRRGQDPWVVTSFVDGTKVSVEQCVVANASGLSVHRRGMLGRDHHAHVDELAQRYDVEELRALGGAVDYVVGAQPATAVYCLGVHDDPKQQHYLELYGVGAGPLHNFYAPHHLRHFEIPITVARMVLTAEGRVRASRTRHVEAVTTAKIDLKSGTVLDRTGGYHYYGQAEKAHVARNERLLPVGAAEGCRLIRDVDKGTTLTYDDVILPPGRLVDELLDAQKNLPVAVPPGLVAAR